MIRWYFYTQTEESMKIQSLYFDAEEGVLEINHNPAGFPVIIE